MLLLRRREWQAVCKLRLEWLSEQHEPRVHEVRTGGPCSSYRMALRAWAWRKGPQVLQEPGPRYSEERNSQTEARPHQCRAPAQAPLRRQ